jgi:hypothetical protein
VGLATATSPLLSTGLTGPVVLVQGATLPQLGVDLQGPLSLQLLGSFTLSQGQGNSFQGLPDIPISHFELRFHGGSGALISTATDLCQLQPPQPLFHTDFDGWNGATQQGDTTAKVVGCGGGGGVQKPKASVKLAKAHSKRPRMRFQVRAGSAPVRGAKLKLPRSLRFAGTKKFRRGVTASDDTGALSRSAIHRRKRALKVNAAIQGTRSLTVRARHGALRRVKRIARVSKLHFKVTVRDVDGRSTSLTVSARKAR